jgi:NitT/TauT family transport system ATP-binding protein
MCDRILVFSANPGRVGSEIKVDLPQPRNRQDPAFRALVEDIYGRMTARNKDQPARDGLFPGMGLGMTLPEVPTDSFASLAEALDGQPKAEETLANLATDLFLEVDELFPIADTLQLFRFAEIEGNQIRLTAAGQRYAGADVDARKQLFAQHLLTYVPLAGHIRRILDERPQHKAPARRFRDELEDYMSEDYAEQTLRAVTGWGRYGEVFAYDETSDLFTLENPT